MVHDKTSFLALLPNLINQVEETHSEEIFDQIVGHFKKYLANNPFDTEIWLKFAILFLQLPKDEDRALNCLQKILEYDPENVIAKLLFACFADYFGGVDKPIFEMLCAIKTSNRGFLSIVELEKSWHYSYINKELYKKTLLKSINYCDTFVLNHKLLGVYYLCEENDTRRAHICFQKALNNIQHVYTFEMDYNPLDVHEFINERLKGIHLTEPNFESLQSLLESCK
jgi:tetratricopeptide (TPR) repeat protein